MRGSAKYPGEGRRTDEQFQFHTRNPALVSSVYFPPVSSVKGGKGVKGQPGNEGERRRLGVPCVRMCSQKKNRGQKCCCTDKQEKAREKLPFVMKKSMMYCCLSYLIPSHAVLLAERPAVFKPAQLGPGVASCSTAELDCVGSWHRMQLLLHLCRRGPVRGACNQRTVGVEPGLRFPHRALRH